MKTSIVLLMIASLCACQNPTMSKIANGVETYAPAVCEAVNIFLHDPVLGDVCATVDEFERARKSVGADDTHLICACILNERADAAKDGGR